MGRMLKYAFRIAVMAVLAFVGYALIADLPPPTREIVVPLSAPGGK